MNSKKDDRDFQHNPAFTEKNYDGADSSEELPAGSNDTIDAGN